MRRKSPRHSRLLMGVLLICVSVGIVFALVHTGIVGGAFGVWDTGVNSSSGPSDSSLGSVDDSAKALDQLPVLQTRSGSVPRYSRDEFGQRWADVDRNGCDTRNDILRRDLRSLQMKTSSPNCVVVGESLTTLIRVERLISTRVKIPQIRCKSTTLLRLPMRGAAVRGSGMLHVDKSLRTIQQTCWLLTVTRIKIKGRAERISGSHRMPVIVARMCSGKSL